MVVLFYLVYILILVTIFLENLANKYDIGDVRLTKSQHDTVGNTLVYSTKLSLTFTMFTYDQIQG